MKNILILILVIVISFQGLAQNEFVPKFKPIPAKNLDNKEDIPPPDNLPKKDPPAVVKKPDPLSINPEELFKNPNLYKKESNSEGIFYRRNQFLGSFSVKTFIATIRFRDAAFVDGDKIKVYLNDREIVSEVSMEEEYQGFKITLAPGVNKIDFEALNEGFASPNTAEFDVYDDKGKLVYASEWNVGTGYKATILLVKE